MSSKDSGSPAQISAGGVPAANADPGDRPVKRSMKEMSKAERREYQEAQRRAKEATKSSAPAGNKNKPAAPPKLTTSGSTAQLAPPMQQPQRQRKKSGAKNSSNSALEQQSSSAPVHKTMHLFSHLVRTEPQCAMLQGEILSRNGFSIHPMVARLRQKLDDCQLSAASERARGMLQAFQALIADYVTPRDAVLSRHLTQVLAAQISYLSEGGRLLGASMGNAIRYLKHHISVLDVDLAEPEAKAILQDRIEQYLYERIVMAKKVLAEHAMSKIKEGDVILTFGYSSAVRHLLVRAHHARQYANVAAPEAIHDPTVDSAFRVIVVDARPKFEARRMARSLLDAGVPTTYVLIHSLEYAMRQATKVILGAHALLGNGAVVGRAGSAQVALLASQRLLPVLVACETSKFTSNIHLDSIVSNELGSPDEIATLGAAGADVMVTPPELGGAGLQAISGISDAASGIGPVSSHPPALGVLNFLFDVTPPSLVTVVITELGPVPGTSVPVVLREYKPLLES